MRAIKALLVNRDLICCKTLGWFIGGAYDFYNECIVPVISYCRALVTINFKDIVQREHPNNWWRLWPGFIESLVWWLVHTNRGYISPAISPLAPISTTCTCTWYCYHQQFVRYKLDATQSTICDSFHTICDQLLLYAYTISVGKGWI